MNHNRIRISGEITQKYEQTIELSDIELEEFRNRLNLCKDKGDQAIDDFLGENYADIEPIDWQYDFWETELIDDNGSVIENIT